MTSEFTRSAGFSDKDTHKLMKAIMEYNKRHARKSYQDEESDDSSSNDTLQKDEQTTTDSPSTPKDTEYEHDYPQNDDQKIGQAPSSISGTTSKLSNNPATMLSDDTRSNAKQEDSDRRSEDVDPSTKRPSMKDKQGSLNEQQEQTIINNTDGNDNTNTNSEQPQHPRSEESATSTQGTVNSGLGDVIQNNVKLDRKQSDEKEPKQPMEKRTVKDLVGKKLDKFGNVLDDSGKIIGKVSHDFSSMEGKQVNEIGEIIDEETGKLLGKVEPIDDDIEPAKDQSFGNDNVSTESTGGQSQRRRP